MRATLIDHGASKTYELDLRVHVQDGERPDGASLEIEDDGAFSGIVHYAPGERAPLRLRVTLAGEPKYVAQAMEAAFGAYVYPRIAYMLGGRLMPPDESHALLLAAAMRAAASHVRGEAGEGRASSGAFEVLVRADFGDPRPAGPGPSRDTPEGQRAWARFVAHATAAQMPMPYYDGYVCVVAVAEPPDDLALWIWAKTEELASAKPTPGRPARAESRARLSARPSRWKEHARTADARAPDRRDAGRRAGAGEGRAAALRPPARARCACCSSRTGAAMSSWWTSIRSRSRTSRGSSPTCGGPRS